MIPVHQNRQRLQENRSAAASAAPTFLRCAHSCALEQRAGSADQQPRGSLSRARGAASRYVVAFDDDTPKALIEAVTPHVLCKGEDWRDKGVVGREWVEAHGGQVVLVPLVPGCSTTNVIEKIQKLGR